jgi:hypothetical protein
MANKALAAATQLGRYRGDYQIRYWMELSEYDEELQQWIKQKL